ncbi:MAG: hypothetical protein AAGI30_05850 [Planctomycetota bacterium]
MGQQAEPPRRFTLKNPKAANESYKLFAVGLVLVFVDITLAFNTLSVDACSDGVGYLLWLIAAIQLRSAFVIRSTAKSLNLILWGVVTVLGWHVGSPVLTAMMSSRYDQPIITATLLLLESLTGILYSLALIRFARFNNAFCKEGMWRDLAASWAAIGVLSWCFLLIACASALFSLWYILTRQTFSFYFHADLTSEHALLVFLVFIVLGLLVLWITVVLWSTGRYAGLQPAHGSTPTTYDMTTSDPAPHGTSEVDNPS